MSKIEQIQTFIKVIEEQSVQGAAAKLHLSSAAISKQIQALEANLGVSLFDRSRRQLIPTPIGRRYYEEAILALKGLTQLEASIKTNRSEAHGILKVRATHYHAVTKILPGLKAFLQKYPNLQLKLEIHEILPDLVKEEVDIVYGPSIQGEANWIQKKIGEVRYVLCATPAYFQKAGIPKTRVELSQHRYLTHMGRLSDSLVRFVDQVLAVEQKRV